MVTAVPRPIRLAVQLYPQHAGYPAIRDTVSRLEDLGVDIVFNWDHFYPLSGDRDGLHFEAWTVVAAIAEQTDRIEFGTLVNCNSYRNPNLHADMARTVDHISAGETGAGRFIFGIGAGWYEKDYREYGYEFGTVGERLDELAANLPVIENRWSKINPSPTHKIPVLVGGGGEKKTLRLVAKHADIWHSFSDPVALERKLPILATHALDVGRDVAEIEVSVELDRRSSEEVERMKDLGATLFTIGISGPDYDLTEVRHWLAWRDAQNA